MLKEISIEIIRRCPNHCLHCSSSSGGHCKEILDYELFTSVVKDAAALGAQTICLSGGEPFLHDRVTDMVQFIASLGLKSYIYTSGIVFEPSGQRAPVSREILAAISPNVTKLIFNIEAANPSTYDAIMGTDGCFELMKQSVRTAQELSITTEAHFVPMKLNIHEIPEVVALCAHLHISKLSFLRLVIHGRAKANEDRLVLSDEESRQLIQLLIEQKRQSEVDIRIGVPLSAHSECEKCEAANGKLNIKYDGRVFPCEVFKNRSLSHCLEGLQPESIYEKRLTDIYEHSPYLGLIRKKSSEFSFRKTCETCIGQYLINKEEQAINGCE